MASSTKIILHCRSLEGVVETLAFVFVSNTIVCVGQEYDGIAVRDLIFEAVDWRYRADYIRSRSTRKDHREFDVEPEWATEAVNDPNAVWFLDPASRSGEGLRVVGYSEGAGHLLVVILVAQNHPPSDGLWWGVNAWAANNTDMRRYREGGWK